MELSVKDLLIVVGLFIALGIVWLFTGGPTRSSSHVGPFIAPPTGNITPSDHLKNRKTEYLDSTTSTDPNSSEQ